MGKGGRSWKRIFCGALRGSSLEEDILRGFEGDFGGGGQVRDHEKNLSGAGIPWVVLGTERPTHFKHNNK